jgi:hypothetical protein
LFYILLFTVKQIKTGDFAGFSGVQKIGCDHTPPGFNSGVALPSV